MGQIHPFSVDVAVLILFFNRPESLSQVFEQVKKARPSKLFLYQDGARGDKDMAGVMACRDVVGEIDWECEVHRMYQDKNYGCDPSEFISQKWAFSIVDKCTISRNSMSEIAVIRAASFCSSFSAVRSFAL